MRNFTGNPTCLPLTVRSRWSRQSLSQEIKVIELGQKLHSLNNLDIQFLKQPPKDGLFVVCLREWIPSTFHFQSCSLLDLLLIVTSSTSDLHAFPYLRNHIILCYTCLYIMFYYVCLLQRIIHSGQEPIVKFLSRMFFMPDRKSTRLNSSHP